MMRYALVLAVTSYVLVAGVGTVKGNEPTMSPPTFKDLCEVVMVTKWAEPSNHAYPTCRTWSRDGGKIFVESAGPGPDGEVRDDARYLLAIEIATGKVEHLTTNEACGGYGFDYAPQGNCIVYQDRDGDHLYLLNLDTMKRGEIVHEPEGTISGPPTISSDGTRVAFWAMMPSMENRFFDNYITVIFAVDVDPAGCKAIGKPRIVEAYPRRKGPNWAETKGRDAVHVNHPQINPANKDHICYSHEMLGSEPDGTVARCRLWQSMVDEDEKRYLVRQPAGLHFTHEVIAPDGKSLIFPYMFGVGQVFFDTREARSIYYNRDCCPGHLTVSPDSKWIAGDTWGDWTDPAGRKVQSVMMFDVPTRRCAHLCWIPKSSGHPAHPHPNFSPDGSRIAFSMLDANGVCQVAYVDVKNVQRKWSDVAQGRGGIAAPAWIEGVERK